MSQSAPPPPSPAPPWAPALAAAAMALPVLAALVGVCTLSVDVPWIDDYDALLAFLSLRDEAGTPGATLSLLIERHNEHRMLAPRATALAVRALLGRLDFTWLNLLGLAHLLLLVAALWLSFRRDLPPRERLLPFAPAVLLLVHPQFWMMYHSPTTSLSGFATAAYVALAFALLERRGALPFAAALALCAAAVLTLANGLLAPILALGVLLVQRRFGAAALWTALAGALLAVYAAGPGALPEREGAWTSLAEARVLALYALNFAGSAAGFSRPGLAPAAGATLLVVLAGAVARGLPRASPALCCLLLFLLGSVAANALGRAWQGAGLPLHQPRYTFYASLLLALAWLSWAELLRPRPARLLAATAAAAVFCAASFALYTRDWIDLVDRLDAGIEQWWTTGEGGLLHPDYRSAETWLERGLDAGWWRPPPDWAERLGAAPREATLPRADGRVDLRLDALGQDDAALYVSGRARVPGSGAQEVFVVLRREGRVLAFPARSVLRGDLPRDDPARARALAPSGFRVVVPKSALAKGPHELGVWVRRGGREHLSYRARPVTVR